MSTNTLEIVSTEASQYFADGLAKQLKVKHRHTIRRQFSDGEHYYRLDLEKPTELVGRDVLVVGSTHTDADLLEIYRVGCALAAAGTRRRIFAIPFFGYSTMERAVHPGEIVTAKANARLLSSIPASGLGNTFVLLDVHAPGLLHYFEGDNVSLEVSAEDLLAAEVEKLHLKDFVLASADLGMSFTVQKFAERFQTSIALVSKARKFEETHVVAAIGDVKNRPVIIYDDMTRSGGSLIKAAETYYDHGASEVYALISHLALNNEQVITDMEASRLVKIISTNSHPMSQHPAIKQSKKIQIIDATPAFVAVVQ